MPNTGHRWTKQEDDLVLMSRDYADFMSRNGDDEITYNAYRFRKATLLREQARELEATTPRVRIIERGEGPEEYIGLRVGFFDFETTFSTQPRLLYGAIADSWGNIEGFDRDTYPGENKLWDDSQMAVAIRDGLERYDILVSWNGKLFDVPVLNGRLALIGERPLNPRMHIDLMYYATGQFMKIGRRSLESVSDYFGAENRKTKLSVRTWDRAMAGDEEAYADIVEHGNADVLVLREVFASLKPHVKNIHR